MISSLKIGLMIAVVFAVLAFFFVRPGCSCTTKEKAYLATTKYDLRNLVTLEEDFYADSQRFSADTAALAFHPASVVRLDILEATDSGWSAVAAHTVGNGSCAVWYGKVSNRPALGDVVGDTSGMVYCAGFKRR